MEKAKQALKPLVLLLMLYFVGECYRLLRDLPAFDSENMWLEVGYFVLVFASICIVFYWNRNKTFAKRLLYIALFGIVSFALELAMAALGVSRALQTLFHVPYVGEFGGAATAMLKGSLFGTATVSAAILCQIVLSLCQRKRT